MCCWWWRQHAGCFGRRLPGHHVWALPAQGGGNNSSSNSPRTYATSSPQVSLSVCNFACSQPLANSLVAPTPTACQLCRHSATLFTPNTYHSDTPTLCICSVTSSPRPCPSSSRPPALRVVRWAAGLLLLLPPAWRCLLWGRVWRCGGRTTSATTQAASHTSTQVGGVEVEVER